VAVDASTGIYFEVDGEGPALLLGFPVFASFDAIMPDTMRGIGERFVRGLADGYRVMTLDYPSIGRSRDVPAAALTADRVVSDILSVASAAGFEHFIYCGYSWGASVGLQLAKASDRIAALALGGWPPMGADYALMLRAALTQVDDPPPDVQVVLREPARYAQWVSYYRSLQDVDQDALLQSLAGRGIPCLAYVGEHGDTTAGEEAVCNATILRHHRRQLEELGWQVNLVPGAEHAMGLDPDQVLPLLRDFLDARFL